MLLSSVLQADVVGVMGLENVQRYSPEEMAERLHGDPRSASGSWRGIDHMLRLGQLGFLRDKVVTTTHLYMGLLDHMDEIVAAAPKILLITNRMEVPEKFRAKFPGKTVECIGLGSRKRNGERFPKTPDFLPTVAAQLPQDMRGTCCLVGAGPWAEIYCSWIKQRGGVAVDLGSGFDLMAGRATRPVHRRLGWDNANPYAL